MPTKRERFEKARYEHRTQVCLEDMAAGKVVSEVVGSIQILRDLLQAGYARVVMEYEDRNWKYRDVGITEAGRLYLVDLQARPKNYTVGPHGAVKLKKEG